MILTMETQARFFLITIPTKSVSIPQSKASQLNTGWAFTFKKKNVVETSQCSSKIPFHFVPRISVVT